MSVLIPARKGRLRICSVLAGTTKSKIQLRNDGDMGPLDILVVRCEQKQHSLGIGKFATGSSFLITTNVAREAAFNHEANKPRTVDQKLATFYRENVSDAVLSLVKEQAASADKLARCNPSRELAVNGPFVLEHGRMAGTDVESAEMPDGCSYGFVVSSWTAWGGDDDSMTPTRQIEPGVLDDEPTPPIKGQST